MDVVTPPRPPARRFTLVDGMILVAATAAGLAARRAYASWSDEDLMGDLREVASQGQLRSLALALLWIALPVLAAWTLALIPLGLLKPRPRPRHLGRRPGWIVGLSVGTATGFLGIFYSTLWLLVGEEIHADMALFVGMLPPIFGLTILATWTTLIVGRRWRAEPTWVDRMGRALGALWILIGLASPFLLVLM